MQFSSAFRGLFLVFVLAIYGRNSAENVNDDTADYLPRTVFGNQLLLIPALVTIGLKFFLLLPILLSKIILLTVLNFISSTLSLVLSVIVGIRNYFAGTKSPSTQEHVPNEKIVSVEYEFLPPDASFSLAKPQGTTLIQGNVAYGRELETKMIQLHEHKVASQIANGNSLKREDLENHRCYYTNNI